MFRKASPDLVRKRHDEMVSLWPGKEKTGLHHEQLFQLPEESREIFRFFVHGTTFPLLLTLINEQSSLNELDDSIVTPHACQGGYFRL